MTSIPIRHYKVMCLTQPYVSLLPTVEESDVLRSALGKYEIQQSYFLIIALVESDKEEFDKIDMSA